MGGVAAVASFVLGAVSYKEQRSATKKAAKDKKEAIAVETAEMARKDTAEHKKKAGMAKAKIAASGATKSGSMQNYLDELDREYGKELAWTKKASGYASKAAGNEGEVATAGATAGMANSLVGAAGAGYDYGKTQEWWGA